MIKKIKSIENFGIYRNFKWSDETKEFNERNILYGWNYSGKTTLSRIFSSIRDKNIHEDFKDSRFKILLKDDKEVDEQNLTECELSISIFNSEYIERNFKWETNEDLNGILFEVGETGELRQQILEKQKKIERLKLREKKFDNVINEFMIFDKKKFTDKAKEIRRDHLHNMIDFNKRNLNSLVERLSIDKYEDFIIENDEQIQSLKASVLQTKPKDILKNVKYKKDIEPIISEVQEILKCEPEELKVISVLEDDVELYDWVEIGKELHEDRALKRCAFCDNHISEQRLDNLNKFYMNQYSLLMKRINNAKNKIESNKVYIKKNTINYSKNDFEESLQSKYISICDHLNTQKNEYLNFLRYLDKELDYKVEMSLYKKMEIENNQTDYIREINNLIKQINDLIDEHNKYVKEFEKRISTDRETLQNHFVALFLKDENYFEKQKRFYKANNLIERLNIKIETVENEIESIEERISSIKIGKEKFETFIQMLLVSENITIDIVDDSKFKLMRHGELAKNLSEGEKTAISFAYFLVYLESLHERGLLKNEIIFIDDPISSLDSQHIAQVYSLINNFFFRKDQNADNPEEVVSCFKQLFISTHNFEFFSFLKDSPNIKRKKRNNSMHEFYLIKRNSEDSSEIENLPVSLLRYKSEYVYLFKLINDYYENKELDSDLILLPNAIRRFLEMYTLTKLPGSNKELDGRMMELFTNNNKTYNLKALHHFSHFNTFEKLYKYDDIIMNIPNAVEEVLNILKDDKTHYDSLIKAIS